MTIDLAVQSTYQIGAVTRSVVGIEQLGWRDNYAFISGSGADVITTTNDFNHDWIQTGLGDDTVILRAGRDLVDLGGGNDLLVVDWSDSTDKKWSGPLTGTLAAGYAGTYLWYNNGDDGGHDRADFTGVERFQVLLGSENDRLYTGDGADSVNGGAGNDILITGKGADTINGAAHGLDNDNIPTGPDIWVGDKSDATVGMTINLNAAVSTYTVGGVASTVRGIEQLGWRTAEGGAFQSGSGADTITTQNWFFDDWIATNGGADKVTLLGGRDLVDLGAGADTLVVDWSDSTDQKWSTAVTGTLASGYGGMFFWLNNSDDGGHDRADYAGVEHFSISTGSHNDRVVTGDGNDTLSGGAGADTLVSAKGVDSIEGGNGVDLWEADKSFATSSQAIVLNLQSGALQTYLDSTVRGIEWVNLATGAGADEITTSTLFLNDVVSTNGGADTVSVFGGRDVANLGNGSDLLVVDWSTSVDRFWSGSLGGTFADGYAGLFYWQPNGDDGAHNRVDFTGVERFSVSVGSAADYILTGDGADTVSGGGGDDLLVTGKGIDVVEGGGGTADRWVADKSFATSAQGIVLDFRLSGLQTYLTTGSVRGIEQIDLKTGAGDDTLITTNAFLNDVVTTNAGDDAVSVFAGRDVVNMGGQGDLGDVLTVNWSGSNDTLRTAWNASDANGFNGIYYWVSNPDDGGRNRVDFTGVERFNVSVGGGNDWITTGDKADTVKGGAGDDILTTGRGEDIIDGGDGIDSWVADKSNVSYDIEINLTKSSPQEYGTAGSIRGIEAISLKTGSGNDVITTGAGFYGDYVETRIGSDTVKLLGGRDVISLGSAGSKGDKMAVNWEASTDSFTMTPLGSDANGYSGVLYNRANGDAGNRVDFSGVERFNLVLGLGADIVVSGDFADTLSGGGGADSLSGMLDNDKLYGGDGSDTLSGGVGADLLGGGGGIDYLYGGTLRDTYLYSDVSDSAAGAGDWIMEWDDLDRIDLRGVDANTTANGDQKFTKAAAFTGVAGQLIFTNDGTNTLVQGDVDGDGVADLEIHIAGVHTTLGFLY